MYKLKFYNVKLGPYVVTPDPIGINELEEIFKRDNEHQGIIHEIIIDLEFIKGARAYVKQAFEVAGGIDAVVYVSSYKYDEQNYTYKHNSTGKINFKRYKRNEEKISVNLEQTGVEHSVLNQLEIDVDLEAPIVLNDGTILPGLQLDSPLYHSQIILKVNDFKPSTGDEYAFPDAMRFRFTPGGERDRIVGGVMVVKVSTEAGTRALEQAFQYPASAIALPGQPLGFPAMGDPINGLAPGELNQYVGFLSSPENLAARLPDQIAEEESDLEVDIQYALKPSVIAYGEGDVDLQGFGVDSDDDEKMGFLEVKAWFEHRGADNSLKMFENFGTWNTEGYGGFSREGEFETHSFARSNIHVLPGDKLYHYLTYRVYGRYEAPAGGLFAQEGAIGHEAIIQQDVANTHVRFKAATFAPASSVPTIFLHDAIERCCQFITGVQNCFHSPLLGRTELGYAEDGKGAMIGLTSGNKLRANGKHIIANLKDLLEFVNAAYCSGYGFEIIDGVRKFVVDKRQRFYNKDLRITNIGVVHPVEAELDASGYWSQVHFGYNYQIDIQQTNGAFEFNTFRKATIPIRNTKNILHIETKMRASGAEIEFQRRLAGTDIDSKLDDENFVVVLMRSATGFRTKASDGYEYIKNVAFSRTAYNVDISPMHMLNEWKEYIASCLIYSEDKILRVNYGELNYQMATKKPGEDELAEDGVLDLTDVVPWFEPDKYNVHGVLNNTQKEQMRERLYGYVEFNDIYGNAFGGYIGTGGITVSQNEATEFDLIKVHRQKLN